MNEEPTSARITRSENSPQHDSGRAFADLMLAIRDGRRVDVEVSRMSPAIVWEDQDGRTARFHSDESRWYGPWRAPSNQHDLSYDGEERGSHEWVIDQLLTAARYGWPIRIFRHNGTGVLSWERQSHGHHPAVTLDQDDRMTFYRELPAHLEAPQHGTAPDETEPENEDAAAGRKEMLERIASEAIRATGEGGMLWEELFRPSSFRSRMHRHMENHLDLEVHHEPETGRFRMAVRHNGDLVTSFHPERQEELRRMTEQLHRNALEDDEKIRWMLEAVSNLRHFPTKYPETTMSRTRWTIARTLTGMDESEDEEIELNATIIFTCPDGQMVDWSFWEDALDFYLQYDDLNSFVQDRGYWHTQEKFLMTGTAFRFNLEGIDLAAPQQGLTGEGIRYEAQGSPGGTITTLTEKKNIVSQVKFEIVFNEPGRARPVLAYLAMTHLGESQEQDRIPA